MAKKSTRKPATPGPKSGKSEPKKPKPLQMSPIARALLENARKRSPLDAASPRKLSGPEVDAIRQFAIALAENELSADDEDLLMICNRITEPPAVPIADLRYDSDQACVSTAVDALLAQLNTRWRREEHAA